MKNIETVFEKLYKTVTIFALACLITPFVYALFFQMLGLNIVLTFITPMFLLTAGYFIQAAFGKITKVKRKKQDLAYESNTKFFNMKDAALPITICVVIAFVLFNVVTGYMKFRFETGIDLTYDRDSLYPYMMLFMGSAIMIAGVVMWFYPYNRIISLRSLFVYFVLFAIGFIFTFNTQWISTLCLVLFVLCALIILNQSNIIKTISLTKVGVVTPNVRLYNIGIVFLFIGAVICTLIVVAAILVGLTVVVQFLFFVTLGAIFNDGSGVEGTHIAESIGEASFDISLLNMSSDNGAVHALWYLFILIVVLLILSLIFIKSIRKVFKSISDFFGSLINNIISLFTDMFFFFSMKNPDVEIDYINYRDEEIDVDKISAKIKMQEFSKKRYSYREYTAKFNSLKTVNEKYVFAYQSLIECWRSMDFSIRDSDTPRQIRDKVLARTTIDEVPDITSIFEEYHYSGKTDVEYNAETLPKIAIMNILIEKYYD